MTGTTEKDSKLSQAKSFVSKYTVYIVFAVLFIAMCFLSDSFLTLRNMKSIMLNESTRGMLALGLSFTMICSGIDLSVGSTLALCGCLAASLVQDRTYASAIFPNLPAVSPVVAILISLVVGALIGLANGYTVAYLRVPPFIATLASQTIVNGAALLFTNAYPVPNLHEGYLAIGQTTFGELPIVAIYFVILAIIAWVILNRLRLGRYMYAVGGNEASARVAGINVEHVKLFVYVWSSVLAALAGIILTARTGSGIATMGDGYQMDAISASVVGGVSQSGGIGKVSGMIIGVLTLGIINNGLLILGVNVYVQLIVKGFIIVLAVILDMRKVARRS